MGPAPLLEPPDWDTHSVESRYTEESKVGFDTQVNIIILNSSFPRKAIVNHSGWMLDETY